MSIVFQLASLSLVMRQLTIVMSICEIYSMREIKVQTGCDCSTSQCQCLIKPIKHKSKLISAYRQAHTLAHTPPHTLADTYVSISKVHLLWHIDTKAANKRDLHKMPNESNCKPKKKANPKPKSKSNRTKSRKACTEAHGAGRRGGGGSMKLALTFY